MQLVDAHVHFWDIETNYLPWLCDEPRIPFRYGDYSRLKGNYLPADYRADSAAFDVQKTVYVEAEYDPLDPLGETTWVDSLRRAEGMPSAMVAQAWLDRADALDVLNAQASFSFVRGVRHKPKNAQHMKDPRWRRGFALLGPLGLSFDLQAPFEFFEEAVRLALDFPDTSIAINHAGLPSDRSVQGLARWRRAMAELSRCPNVCVKISGLGLPTSPWRVGDNRAIVLTLIDSFGSERCMFASNFPVDSLVASFDEIYSGFFEIVQHLSSVEQKQLFFDNAARFYRL